MKEREKSQAGRENEHENDTLIEKEGEYGV